MGQKTSSQSQVVDYTCAYCGTDVLELATDQTSCKRCQGPLEQSAKPKSDVFTTEEETKIKVGPDVLIKRIQILPFKETLPEEYADREIMDDQSLLDNFLTPYFRENHPYAKVGKRFQIREVDWKVTACHPPYGKINENTKIRCMSSPLSVLQNISQLHILPTKVSIDSVIRREKKEGKTEDTIDPKELFTKYVKPYFSTDSGDHEPRHIALGDLFMSGGIQFKVMAAEPSNGLVTKVCQIHTQGEPLVDIKRIHILPIYETLPNPDKTITEQKMMEKYLKPFFIGTHQFVKKGVDLHIDGVEFKIVAVEPESGLVTQNTEIYNNGTPISYDDIKAQRIAQDQAMARRLQQQESGGLRFNFHGGHRFARLGSHETQGLVLSQALLANPQEIRYLLAELGAGVGQQNQQPAASTREINNLPTHQWKSKDALSREMEQKNQDKELTTCMVCLEEYEQDQWLRTLPCFHFYHQECIDKWLVTNNTCPVCKHPAS